jgi:hypothetical protein
MKLERKKNGKHIHQEKKTEGTTIKVARNKEYP